MDGPRHLQRYVHAQRLSTYRFVHPTNVPSSIVVVNTANLQRAARGVQTEMPAKFVAPISASNGSALKHPECFHVFQKGL